MTDVTDFLAENYRSQLSAHGLDSYTALWEVPLQAVDEPNEERGGWSYVYRLELDGAGFFLKRQSNYFTRTFLHPLGEPTVAREFRNIRRYAKFGVPSLEAVFYGQRRTGGECRALLLTRALDGWQPLQNLLTAWDQREAGERRAIIQACSVLIGKLHAAGLRHGCLYPKHLFLRSQPGSWDACLIDLEKTRSLWLTWRGRVKDLETFLRTVRIWTADEEQAFLVGYLGVLGKPAADLPRLQELLGRRRLVKEQRH